MNNYEGRSQAIRALSGRHDVPKEVLEGFLKEAT